MLWKYKGGVIGSSVVEQVLLFQLQLLITRCKWAIGNFLVSPVYTPPIFCFDTIFKQFST